MHLHVLFEKKESQKELLENNGDKKINVDDTNVTTNIRSFTMNGLRTFVCSCVLGSRLC